MGRDRVVCTVCMTVCMTICITVGITVCMTIGMTVDNTVDMTVGNTVDMGRWRFGRRPRFRGKRNNKILVFWPARFAFAEREDGLVERAKTEASNGVQFGFWKLRGECDEGHATVGSVNGFEHAEREGDDNGVGIVNLVGCCRDPGRGFYI